MTGSPGDGASGWGFMGMRNSPLPLRVGWESGSFDESPLVCSRRFAGATPRSEPWVGADPVLEVNLGAEAALFVCESGAGTGDRRIEP